MLKTLALTGIGPAETLQVDFSDRLNLITGDNGLGKSFLLEVAWFALTRTWSGQAILPIRGSDSATIEVTFSSKSKADHKLTSRFNRKREQWTLGRGRPPNPGLVVYARVDGGFSCWDPARHYWQDDSKTRSAKDSFSSLEIWHGNEQGEGLVRDWASWQREKSHPFQSLEKVLLALSPDPQSPLRSGELRPISLTDPKKYPTLIMAYGQEIAVTQASAGMQRIIALAYFLVWTWTRHREACEHYGLTPTSELVFLIDELEAHLHPQWQRRVAPALLKMIQELTECRVQLIAATHSPLVLASCEPDFDEDLDAVWELQLEAGQVTLEKFPWHRRGDANSWLTSSVFNLKRARSLPAEEALEAARRVLHQSQPRRSEVERVTKLLQASLSDTDPFWVRWSTLQ